MIIIRLDDIEFCNRLYSIGQILLIKNGVIQHKEKEAATVSGRVTRLFSHKKCLA